MTIANQQAFPRPQHPGVAFPGMTYHQYLVAHLVGRHIPEQNIYSPIVRTPAEHAVHWAITTADLICAEYDRRAAEKKQ